MSTKKLYATFRGAKLIKVLRVEVNEGEGLKDDPVRRIVYYVDLEGNIISHNDPIDREFRGES